jgi:hypothetical protein
VKYPITFDCLQLIFCVLNTKITTKVKGKGTAIPSKAWTSPEDSGELRLPDFKTLGT